MAVEHWLFQLANALLFVSYVSPSLLFLRIALACAALCFVLWGAIILDSIDTMVWNSLFCFINSCFALSILYSMRPLSFNDAEEDLYRHVFKEGPGSISRNDFHFLCRTGKLEILELGAGSTYCAEGHVCEHFSILMAGELLVLKLDSNKEQRVLNVIKDYQLIDTPEWANRERPPPTPQKARRSFFGRARRAGDDAETAASASAPDRSKAPATETIAMTPAAPAAAPAAAAAPAPALAATSSSHSSSMWALLKAVSFSSALEKARPIGRPAIVTLRAMTKCKIARWRYENMDDVLAKSPTLPSAINSLISVDLAHKLLRLETRTIASSTPEIFRMYASNGETDLRKLRREHTFTGASSSMPNVGSTTVVVDEPEQTS